jgi:hypothetical protein
MVAINVWENMAVKALSEIKASFTEDLWDAGDTEAFRASPV